MSDSVKALYDRYGPNYRWIATATVTAGSVGIILSSTIVNVAIPDVMGTFGVGQDQAQWIATAFLASQTVSQLITAWAIETLGIRLAYLLTLILFSIGAVVGGLAPNMETLAFARVLQGAAAGIVLPTSMIVMALIFPPERKGLAMGIFSMGTVLAPSIGPVLGGIAIDNHSWRLIFFIPLPLCILAFFLGARFMPTRERTAKKMRFDWLGVLLLSTAIICALTALSRGQRVGWLSDEILLRACVAVIASYAFVVLQLRSSSPLLDFSVLRNKQFAAACMIAVVFGAGLFATTYYIPVMVQTVLDYDATHAGLILAPGGLVLMILFPLTGRLADSIPAMYLIVAGLLILSYGFFLMGGIDVNTAFLAIATMTVVGRVGLGFIFPPLNAAALRALPNDAIARGSGTLNFFRQLGGAFGVSLLVIAIEQRAQLHGASLSATQTADNQTSKEFLGAVTRLLGEGGIPESIQPGSALQYLGDVVHAQATSLAYQDAAFIISATFLLAIIPALILSRRRL
jgi:DHA2 family multidrug resistance protein